MKQSINILLLFILFLGLSHLLKAQDNTQPINLETVLELGGANNLTIKEYKERQTFASANLSKAKEWWLPNLYAGISMHQLSGTAMNSDGKFFTDINRQNFWGGVGLNATWNFGDGVFKANAAALKVKATAYKTQEEKNTVLVEIINTDYDFLASQLYYTAYEQLAAQADTIAGQIEIQVKAGLRFESELLLAKSNYLHLKVEMLNARVEFNNYCAALVNLLHIKPDTKLIGTETVMAPIDLVGLVENNFDLTYNLHPELKGMELNLQSLNVEKKTTTTGLLLPALSVGAYSSYFGGIFSPLDPTSAVNGALTWKIPLGRLVFKGSLKQYNSKIALQGIQLEQVKSRINEEIIRTRVQIRMAREQTEIAMEGSQLAGEALKQSIQRQQLGTVRPFEILQAQELYIKSRLDYLKAVASYNKSQYAYHVATGNNL